MDGSFLCWFTPPKFNSEFSAEKWCLEIPTFRFGAKGNFSGGKLAVKLREGKRLIYQFHGITVFFPKSRCEILTGYFFSWLVLQRLDTGTAVSNIGGGIVYTYMLASIWNDDTTHQISWNYIPFLKLTASSHLKMDGWNMIVSIWGVWDSLFSGVFPGCSFQGPGFPQPGFPME